MSLNLTLFRKLNNIHKTDQTEVKSQINERFQPSIKTIPSQKLLKHFSCKLWVKKYYVIESQFESQFEGHLKVVSQVGKFVNVAVGAKNGSFRSYILEGTLRIFLI